MHSCWAIYFLLFETIYLVLGFLVARNTRKYYTLDRAGLIVITLIWVVPVYQYLKEQTWDIRERIADWKRGSE